MVSVPAEIVINNTLLEGSIYKFKAEDLISTTIPHIFIVVAIASPNLYLVLCTSQKENKERYFDNNNLSYSSLVYVKPNSSNGLTIDTFVNCNDYFTLTKKRLLEKCGSGNFEYLGRLSENHYEQIKQGIIDSETNDLPKDLLVYPKD